MGQIYTLGKSMASICVQNGIGGWRTEDRRAEVRGRKATKPWVGFFGRQRLEGLGSAVSFRVGSGAKPRPLLILRVLEPRRMHLETKIILFSFKTSKLEPSLLSLSGCSTDVNDCILRKYVHIVAAECSLGNRK